MYTNVNKLRSLAAALAIATAGCAAPSSPTPTVREQLAVAQARATDAAEKAGESTAFAQLSKASTEPRLTTAPKYTETITMTFVVAAPTPKATETLVPTPTPAATVSVSETNFITNTLQSPELFDKQSTGKEYRATYDLGINDGKLGIVFGTKVENLRTGEVVTGCALVALTEGWNDRIRITDGRYEIYTLPAPSRKVQQEWVEQLIAERRAEQAANYKCDPNKEVPRWKAERRSPPTR